MTHRIRNRLAVSLSCLTTLLYACSSDTGETEQPLLTGGTGATGSGGTLMLTGGSGGASGGTGGSGGSIGGTGNIIQPVGGSAGMMQMPVDPDMSCGKGTASADIKPVNMLVMFDRSGSMLDCIDGSDPEDAPCPTGTRWDSASSALSQFFQSPGAADLGVALRFFPHDLPAVGCTGDRDGLCDVAACSQVLVDMGTLTADPAPTDAQEGLLVSAVMTSAPDYPGRAGTPISAALDGALTWATTYQTAHPEQRTVVVFVTDGEPKGCIENFRQIDMIASDALAASGVTTYAIGLTDINGGGVNQADMDGLAMAGGTDQAFFVSDGAMAASDLLMTLNAIRGMAIACDFPVPPSTTSGMAIDPKLVNVNYTASSGMKVELGLVASAAECGTEQAWYYDNPAMPTRIMLCPSACQTVTADSGAAIEILAGCVPRIVVPK